MKYRVWAKMTNMAYLDVEAKDKDEAEAIALDTDGGEFIPDTNPHSGDWTIEEVEEVK